jgi:hypothetical protein
MGRYVVVVECAAVSFVDGKGRPHTVPARVKTMEFALAFSAREWERQAKAMKTETDFAAAHPNA